MEAVEHYVGKFLPENMMSHSTRQCMKILKSYCIEIIASAPSILTWDVWYFHQSVQVSAEVMTTRTETE
jgi:uncharacterized membrane protein